MFRTPGVAYLLVVFLVVCASPVAAAGPWFALLYLIPLGVLYWLVRTRTVMDADRIVVRRTFSTTTLRWSDITSLRMSERGWLRAVRTDGTEVALPTVRARHLPVLAVISGGRITDPTAPAASADEPEDETPMGAGNGEEDVAGADREQVDQEQAESEGAQPT